MKNVKTILRKLSITDRISYIEYCIKLLDKEYKEITEKIILFNKHYKLIQKILYNITNI